MFKLFAKLNQKFFCKKQIEYEFVHIMPKDKFSEPFIEFINKYFDPSKHCFVFFRTSSQKFDVPTKYEHVIVTKPKKLKFNLAKVQKIFIHSMSQKVAKWLYVNKNLLDRCYWIVWGYDIYCEENECSKYVKENVKAVITNFDKTTYLNKYHKDKPIYELPFYPSVVKKEYLDLGVKKKGPITVQVNNCADFSTLEMLEVLSKFKTQNLRVVTILSYGNTLFNEQIIEKGRTLFGDKFYAVMNYFKPQEYAKHLKNIDILVLNQKRQQGVGNVRCNFYLKNKVFIRGEITTYRGFVGQGFKVFDSNEIKNMDFQEFISFSENDQQTNKKLVEGYFDNSDIVASWNYFLSV